MIKKIVALTLVCTFFALSLSCSRTQKGALIGAGAGAVVGGVIGKVAGNTAVGAILGAAVGGAAGAYIGHYMDKQAEEMKRDIAGAKIERVGEGIKITFDSGLMFDVNKASLRQESKDNLAKVAKILNKYEDTDVLLEGHTDATGSDEYNQKLSEKRSRAVANHLVSLAVDSKRFTSEGYGESQPIADNETVEGRQQNRRVEVAIFANEKLKKVAKEQAG